MQNFKDWPAFIKICFGVIISALIAAGLVELPKLNAQQESGENQQPPAEDAQKVLADLVNIEIIVESNASTPLENVEVRFVSKGAPEVRKTNTDGFTQIEIPSRSDIEITLSKNGFETARHTLNLKNDPNRTRRYYLKPQQP